MTDEYRRPDADTLGDQEGDATEPTGKAVDGRTKRHGNVKQTPEDPQDTPPSGESDSTQAQHEQDRQLETGEENPT